MPFFIFVLAKTPSMVADIEPILLLLSNYIQKIPQTAEESNLLRSWLMESKSNEILSDDISNKV